MSARRAGTLAVAMVAAAALLAVLLVTWAASIGPHDVLRGDGPARVVPTATPTSSDSADAQETQSADPGEQTPHAPPLTRWIAVLLNLATVVLAGYLLLRLARWGRRSRRERRRRLARDEAMAGTAFEVVEPSVAVAREMLADAAAQRDVLASGSPRNAVVGCWHRFETQAAAAGVERRAWETSSEHTLRVLDLVDADPAAVSRLLGLYREARFSEHPVAEADRAAAAEALDLIHRTIGASA